MDKADRKQDAAPFDLPPVPSLAESFCSLKGHPALKYLVLSLEAAILFTVTFAYLAGALLFISTPDNPSPMGSADWGLKIILPLGALGLLALWFGFIAQLMLKRKLATVVAVPMYFCFLCGAIADIYFIYGSATIGHGYIGLGFWGSMLVIALYGGPVAICAHIFFAMNKRG